MPIVPCSLVVHESLVQGDPLPLSQVLNVLLIKLLVEKTHHGACLFITGIDRSQVKEHPRKMIGSVTLRLILSVLKTLKLPRLVDHLHKLFRHFRKL